MSKFTVVGASGLAGSNICSILKKEHDVLGLTFDGSSYMSGMRHDSINLSNKEEVKKLLEKENPDVIVYAAGLHGVPQCAALPKDADVKNHQAPVNLVEIADRSMTPCIYISNGYGIGYGNGDLERQPITLEDPSSPESTYGKSKLQAEDFFLARTKVGFVIRSGMLVGRGSGLSLSFWESVEKFLFNKEVISLRKDLIHSWASAHQLGEAVLKLSSDIETRQDRLYQLSSNDGCSPYELVEQYCELMKFDKNLLQILPEDAKEKQRWSPDFNKAQKCLNTYSLEPSGSYQLNPETGNELLESGEYSVKEMLEDYLSSLHT